MQFKFLSYKLNSFLKIISITLLLILSFKIEALGRIYDLNDLEEITISATPKYFSYSPCFIIGSDEGSSNKNNPCSATINDSQKKIKFWEYPIIDMQSNKTIDIEFVSKKLKLPIKITLDEIDPIKIDFTSYELVDKKDYFSYLITRFKDNLANISYTNCRKCSIDQGKVYFNEGLAQHTFQIHDIKKNKFVSGTPYTFKLLADISKGFDYYLEANIEILYGKNFNKKKLLKISNVLDLGGGNFEFQINTNNFSKSKFFKISGIYFNLTNQNIQKKPVNIDYKNLSIGQSFSADEINNTLFVKSSSKIINLKYLLPNELDRNSTYDVKELNRPIKVISDIENYIEKYKIHHKSLINYYKSSLLDIIYGNKIIKLSKNSERSFFSGSSKKSNLKFKNNYKLSQNDNFLNISSPTINIITEVKLNTISSDGLRKSVTINNYTTNTLIPLGSSKFISSIELITNDYALNTKVFDLEFFNVALLDAEILSTNIEESNDIKKFNIKKINIINTSSNVRTMYFQSNQIMPLLTSNIPMSKIKNSFLINHNFECDNESNRIDLLASIYTLDPNTGQLENLFIPLGLESVLRTADIIDSIGDNDFYGMQFYAANFGDGAFFATCSLKVNFIEQRTEFIKTFQFDKSRKIVLRNWEDFLPGHYLIYDDAGMFNYPVVNFKEINYQKSIPQIQFQSILAKFILILLFTGLLKVTRILFNKNQLGLISKNNYFINKLNEVVSNNVAVMTLILFFSLFVYINEINLLHNFYSSYSSLSFLIIYIFMFYNILINPSFIKSEIFKITCLIILTFLSYSLSNDSYTYISILLFAYSFQIIKKLLTRLRSKFYKKNIDTNIWSFLFIAFISIITSLFVHFYINIKFSDYFIVYTYYSALMIFIYKFYNSYK